MGKKENEEASRAVDPALEQGRAAGEDVYGEPVPETEKSEKSEKDEDEVDEASEDSFPTSDAPSW